MLASCAHENLEKKPQTAGDGRRPHSILAVELRRPEREGKQDLRNRRPSRGGVPGRAAGRDLTLLERGGEGKIVKRRQESSPPAPSRLKKTKRADGIKGDKIRSTVFTAIRGSSLRKNERSTKPLYAKEEGTSQHGDGNPEWGPCP